MTEAYKRAYRDPKDKATYGVQAAPAKYEAEYATFPRISW